MRLLMKGRKLHYKTEFQGLLISIENRKGSYRRGKDAKGEWATKMTAPYGYIRGTIGTDGDHVDCFVGPNKESRWVYVIHIKNPKTGKFDEDKTFLGFNSLNEAMATFKKNYDDWARYYMGFDVMEMDEFKEAIKDKGEKISHASPMATQDKEAEVEVGKGRLFAEKDLNKSHVKGHTRTTKTGKVVNVNSYENKKTKTPKKHNTKKLIEVLKNSGKFKSGSVSERNGQKYRWDTYYISTPFPWVVDVFDRAIKENNDLPENKGKKPGEGFFSLNNNQLRFKMGRSKYKGGKYKVGQLSLNYLVFIDKNGKEKTAFEEELIKSNNIKSTRLILKSWSSSLQSKYPGSRWVRITDKSSPLHGRAILIVPHKDGRATIAWAPHHSGLTHKVLSPKKSKKQNDKPQKPADQSKKKKEMSDEEIKSAKERKKKIVVSQQKIKAKMHEKIKSKLGIEAGVTKEEKAKIDKEVSKIADKKERNVERLKRFNKIKTERDKAIDEVIGEAKKAMLGEHENIVDATSEQRKLREAIKENAEEFLQYHYQIKAYQREKNAISRLLRDGGKYSGGNDTIEVAPLSKDELTQILKDEQAVSQEIGDHYSLIVNTRGGIDKDGNEIKGKGTGSKIIEKNIIKGGFEAMTGLTGEATGNSILDLDKYKAMGSNNAAILMNYYFENTLGKEKYTKKMQEIQQYITGDGRAVAAQAMANGDKYLERAQKIKNFAHGEDSLFGDRVQANGMSLQYIQRAYESYGQAEGSLNQAAETLYQFQNKKKSMEFFSNSRQKLNSIRDNLKLNDEDVNIEKAGSKYRMTIPPSSFEKLIKEKPVSEKRRSGEATVSDIKAGKLNTDNYLPEGLNAYLPPDKNGASQKLVLEPHQQSAARLTAKENKVYLNFEAGTGKSLTYLASIAEIKSQTGKMPKTIISMPKKLMPNFQDEVKKFTDFNVVIVDSSSKAKREKLYNGDPNTIVLVNKEKYFFDKDMIENAGFDMMIVDEAHKSTQRNKGKRSGMSKGLAEIASGTKYFIAGTGSPTPNDLSELYFYLKTIDPEKYNSQKRFMEKYQNLHKGAGLKEKLKEILHREIDDKVFTVKKDLKHTFTQHVHNADLSKPQKQRYKKIMVDFKNKKIDALTRDQRINKLLNATGHQENQKFNKMGSIIKDHMKTRGKDEKVIIYAQQYKTVDEIEKYIKENFPGQGVVRFDGKTKLNDIDKNKKSFRTDENVKFAIHTDAGTEGLNLQYTGKPGEAGATTAIAMASGAYSYSTLDQFFSRANRKGVPKEMNIDGHLVLTDTPHDIKTEMRLEDKKAVMNLVDNAKRVDDLGVLGDAMQKSVRYFIKGLTTQRLRVKL